MKLHLPKGLFMALMTAFVGLSQYAVGETFTFDVLADSWTTNHDSSGKTIQVNNGGSNFSVCDFESLGLHATDDQDLRFSLTMSFDQSIWLAGANKTYNFLAGTTFSGSSGAFAVGKFNYDNGPLSYAWGGNGDEQVFTDTGSYGSATTVKTVLDTNKEYFEENTTTPLGVDITITGSLASDGDGTYTLTLTYKSEEYEVDMGANGDLDSIVFYNNGSGKAQIKALTLTGASAATSHTWAGTNAANTWSATSSEAWGSGAVVPKKYDTITFDETGSNKDVNVDGGVAAYDVIVRDNYTFQGDAASDSVKVLNDLSIAAGKTLQLSGEGTLNARTVSGEGSLVLADNSRWTTGSAAVLDAVTGTGDVAISGFVNLVDGQSISSTGKVIIGSGSELRLGLEGNAAALAQTYNIGLNNSGFELAGGQLSARGFAGDLGDINVTETSTIWLVDINLGTGHENDKTSIGTLTVNEGKNLDLDTHWKGRIEVEKLTGAGNVTFGSSSNDNSGRHLTVNSVEGYTGQLTIEERAGNRATLNLTVGGGETFKASQLTACNTSTVVIDGAGTYEMGNQLYIAKGADAEKGSFAATWTGKTSFSGATFNATDLNQYGNANSTVSLGQTSGSLAGTVNTNVELLTHAQNAAINFTADTAPVVTFAGKVSGAGNMALSKSATITYTGDVSDWTGVIWASSNSSITYSGNAKTIANKIYAAHGGTSTVTYKNSTGMEITGGINTDGYDGGTLNLVVENEDGASGEVKFSGVISNAKSTTTNLQVKEGASAALTNATVILNDVVAKAGASLSFTSAPTIKNLTMAEGASLTTPSALALSDGTLTIEGLVTIGGSLLDGLANLKDDETLTLFSGVKTLTLGDETYTQGTHILDADTEIDLSSWLTKADAGTPVLLDLNGTTPSYYLGFDADGNVYAGVIAPPPVDPTPGVPEPTTATLSLLALAGLAARRRRK